MRQLLPKLLKKWDVKLTALTLPYLTDLVNASHGMLKMARTLANEGVMVLSSRRRGKRKDGESHGEGTTSASSAPLVVNVVFLSWFVESAKYLRALVVHFLADQFTE